MPTYTLSKMSSTNTTLVDPDGNIIYEISTPFAFGESETTIKRGNRVIATIQWKVFRKDTLTMKGKSATIHEVFPRSKRSSTVYTMPNGESFKWKDGSKLHCVSTDSGLDLATYHPRATLYMMIRGKKPTLDIVHNVDTEKTDALVVTWVIAETKVRRRRDNTHGGGARAGGGFSGGGGAGVRGGGM